MKNLKIKRRVAILSLISGMIFISSAAFAQGMDIDTEKFNLWQWLTGGGLITGGGLLLNKVRKLSGKIKEVFDIPIAVTNGIADITIQVTEGLVSVRDIFETIKMYKENPNIRFKELYDLIEKKIENADKQLKDIPESIKKTGISINKEINDLIKK